MLPFDSDSPQDERPAEPASPGEPQSHFEPSRASEPGPWAEPAGVEPVHAAASEVVMAAIVKPPPKSEPHLPQPNLGWSLLVVMGAMGVQVAVTVAAVFVFVFVVLATGGSMQDVNGMEAELTVALVPLATFATLVTAIGIAWVLMRGQMGRKLALRICTPWQWLLVLLLLVPQAVVASELANLVQEVIRWINSPLLDKLNDMSWVESFAQQPWPLVLLGACVFPALGEEILFRGVLSRGLVAWHGVVAGSIFASVLFGLMHLVPAQAVATIAIGLVLQLVFLFTRSLWAAILLHLVNNAMAFSAVRFGSVIPVPGFTVDADHIPPQLVLAALLVSVALLGLLYQTRTRWLLPDGSEWSPGFFATETPPAELDAQPVSAAPSLPLSAVALVLMATFAVAVYFSISP